jgi:hypothetical protein
MINAEGNIPNAKLSTTRTHYPAGGLAGQQHNRVGEVLLQPGDKFVPQVNVVDQGLSVTHYTPKT